MENIDISMSIFFDIDISDISQLCVSTYGPVLCLCTIFVSQIPFLKNFVKIKNKWSEIGDSCCENNCINTNNPIGKCAKGYGFVNIIIDENIKYLEGKGSYNNYVIVYAENSLTKPQNSFNYSLYYFEIKCIFEGGELDEWGKWMGIGLRNCNTYEYINLSARTSIIYNEEDEEFKLDNISWNDNDIFGCGLVYPPTNMANEFPYVFFTQNGKQIGKCLIKKCHKNYSLIGKAILLKNNSNSYKPHVWLECCSVESNFGDDLETKPFRYEISKHEILKEFY
ncbi:unnamed protein product [Meloidogyne enterolobii]|uniref:Uncharacterized protein n=1 Tax=Meloidogyne enterolobii TaxID=390850 RepID=A0ACB0YLW7_MELEN